MQRIEMAGFNPRTREGCDCSKSSRDLNCCVSIHAPAKGATGLAGNRYRLGGVSIHAPAKGATLHNAYLRQIDEVSIHAPAKGATIGTG